MAPDPHLDVLRWRHHALQHADGHLYGRRRQERIHCCRKSTRPADGMTLSWRPLTPFLHLMISLGRMRVDTLIFLCKRSKGNPKTLNFTFPYPICTQILHPWIQVDIFVQLRCFVLRWRRMPQLGM